jgi:hypothetical protein
LDRSGLEPTIYGTRGDHDNHYITDVIGLIRRVVFDERGLIRGELLYIDFSPERRP